MKYCHVAVNEGNLKGLLNFLDFLNRSDPYDRFFGLRTLFVCQFFRLGWDAFSTIQFVMLALFALLMSLLPCLFIAVIWSVAGQG